MIELASAPSGMVHPSRRKFCTRFSAVVRTSTSKLWSSVLKLNILLKRLCRNRSAQQKTMRPKRQAKKKTKRANSFSWGLRSRPRLTIRCFRKFSLNCLKIRTFLLNCSRQIAFKSPIKSRIKLRRLLKQCLPIGPIGERCSFYGNGRAQAGQLNELPNLNILAKNLSVEAP